MIPQKTYPCLDLMHMKGVGVTDVVPKSIPTTISEIFIVAGSRTFRQVRSSPAGGRQLRNAITDRNNGSAEPHHYWKQTRKASEEQS